uniref:Uncharacterized protein n=1 Tax=Cucumis melo TaxID=3656 RepID=A0A9I9E9J4_CUCME
MEDKVTVPPKRDWKQMGHEEATVAVHEEMKRVQKFPSNSTYATHRLRVCIMKQKQSFGRASNSIKQFSLENCISGRGTGVAVFWAFLGISCSLRMSSLINITNKTGRSINAVSIETETQNKQKREAKSDGSLYTRKLDLAKDMPQQYCLQRRNSSYVKFSISHINDGSSKSTYHYD